jgi:double-stranded uracil-DNA glycosylase
MSATKPVGAQTNGFAPISDGNAKVLILGTLPGQASLLKNEYYGQPQNAFWRIMGELFEAGPELPYEERKRRIVARHVSVWDVCAAAHRPGSLDASIARDSVVANDIAGFLDSHPAITLICFNGAKAAALYRTLVQPRLPQTEALRHETLPSTSPANAAVPYLEKVRRWSIVQAACAAHAAAGANAVLPFLP